MKQLLLASLGVFLITATVLGLTLHVHQGPQAGTERHVTLFVAILAAAAAAYLAACRLVTGSDAPRSLWWVLLVAIAMRALVLVAPPFLSSDLYRYVWDGRVQQAGINPYRYIPADAALRFLRDETIYPQVNRRDYAPTIYPPTAQLVFRAIAAISQTGLAVRITTILFETLAIACLLLLLKHADLPATRVLIYAWNPLAVWSFAGNGHVDALAAGLIPLALVFRSARRDILTGMALSAAILVKFLPAAIAPALWRRPRLAMPLACAATIVGLYAIYAGPGAHLFGFLRAYGHEEGLDAGSGIWLLAGLGDLVTLPRAAGPIYLVAVALLLAVLAGRIASHPPDRGIVAVTRDAGLLAGAMMVLISPHYPWYFPFLATLATVATSWALTWLSVVPLLLTLDPLHEFFVWPSLVYIPTLALAVVDHRNRRPR